MNGAGSRRASERVSKEHAMNARRNAQSNRADGGRFTGSFTPPCDNLRIVEEKFVEMAVTYREMADKALDPTLRLEFVERAERYETAAWAARRRRNAQVNTSEVDAGTAH